jgi:hypothetical protein
MLTKKHAPLMMWNAHLYIVDGITYVGDVDATTGGIMYVIHKFFARDARFSDSRRGVYFDRVTEDAGNVQGLLFLQAAPQ